MKDQKEYEQQERREAQRKIDEVDMAPLSDRQEARASWRDSCVQHPELVAERVRWLLNGSYGYGPMKMGEEIALKKGRFNKVAALGQLIAVLEWQCPMAWAQQVCSTLRNTQELDRLNAAIAKEIEDWKKERKEEETRNNA